MSTMIISGGRRLDGEITVHGAKNSVLPILAACFATGAVCELSNCPRLTDVEASLSILRYLGCSAEMSGDSVTVDASGGCRCDVPDSLMREMRSSISFLGAILARCGEAVLTAPGGCELGRRPIDLHLSSLARMGVCIEETHGFIRCTAGGRLKGANINLSFPSVGATENIMVAASTAIGETVIMGAAREPEICDLACFLRGCGARIKGDGSDRIVIEGVERLHGCRHRVIPDRIEAITYLAAGGITGGHVVTRSVEPMHIASVLSIFSDMGCRVRSCGNGVELCGAKRLRSAGCIRTMPYPGFPTDAQAILMAMACVGEGRSVFYENIFEGRYRHVEGLRQMGARIEVDGRTAIVEGVERLRGAKVWGTDLRGAAAMVLAGLAAEGDSEVWECRHIERGYEGLEEGLAQLGASIRKAP